VFASYITSAAVRWRTKHATSFGIPYHHL
jgi:hypothetical protein